jgi:hypothetical protein
MAGWWILLPNHRTRCVRTASGDGPPRADMTGTISPSTLWSLKLSGREERYSSDGKRYGPGRSGHRMTLMGLRGHFKAHSSKATQVRLLATYSKPYSHSSEEAKRRQSTWRTTHRHMPRDVLILQAPLRHSTLSTPTMAVQSRPGRCSPMQPPQVSTSLTSTHFRT